MSTNNGKNKAGICINRDGRTPTKWRHAIGVEVERAMKRLDKKGASYPQLQVFGGSDRIRILPMRAD